MNISIIIPALNEAGGIDRAVSSAAESVGTKVIVVDGGSRDRTRGLPAPVGASCLSWSRAVACSRTQGPGMLPAMCSCSNTPIRGSTPRQAGKIHAA